MNIHSNTKAPDSKFECEIEKEIRHIVEFWNRLRTCDDELGETSWEELEPYERLVTECLYGPARDLNGARLATVKAMMLLTR